MEMVKAANLFKSYGSFRAVKDVSFAIRQGEIFGFLGPNGAGKTSTINMLIGLSRPTSGQISIAGVDAVKDTVRTKALIGVVPDESNLYDEMDGFDNLCFCASLYGMRRTAREARAKELLAQFQLSEAGKKRFGAYSKGMKRKLTIAAGIIHAPRVLFLDEPTTGIDVESARQIRALLLDLKRRGTTLFLTTHYIEDAEKICDRVAFIVDGQIVANGSLDELMSGVARGHTIQLSVDDGAGTCCAELQSTFPQCRISASEHGVLLQSDERVSLSPVLQFLDGKGVSVYEARELKPSLEDVFVQVTGVAAARLKQERERGGGKR